MKGCKKSSSGFDMPAMRRAEIERYACAIGVPLLPYGVEPTGHAWLHSRCWEAWHAARKREAAAALKAMGVGKPMATE